MVGHAGRVEYPQHAHVPVLVGDGGHRVELRVRAVFIVRHEDRLRLGPVNEVGTLGAAYQPLADGAPPVQRILHVHRVDLAYGVPPHEHGGAPAAVPGPGVDDRVVLVRPPLERVRRVVQVDGHPRRLGRAPARESLEALRRVGLVLVVEEEGHVLVRGHDVVLRGAVVLEHA